MRGVFGRAFSEQLAELVGLLLVGWAQTLGVEGLCALLLSENL